MKTSEQKIDEIHTAVTKLEERVPEALRERLTTVENSAHASPCRALRSRGRFYAGVGVAVVAWLVVEILKLVKGG